MHHALKSSGDHHYVPLPIKDDIAPSLPQAFCAVGLLCFTPKDVEGFPFFVTKLLEVLESMVEKHAEHAKHSLKQITESTCKRRIEHHCTKSEPC